MQHNSQNNWSNNNHSGGRDGCLLASYSVVKPDGTVITWTLSSSSSVKQN